MELNEPYSVIMGLWRARLTFSLIRSAITCLCGTRRRMIAHEVNNAVLIMQKVALWLVFIMYLYSVATLYLFVLLFLTK